MGIDRHHAIVVTAGNEEWIEKAHTEALRIFSGEIDDSDRDWSEMVTPVIRAPVNFWWTFFIGPDGGKETWDSSRLGEQRRAAFVSWLKTQVDKYGGCPFQWVFVQYHDESNLETKIIDDSDAEERAANDEQDALPTR